MIVQGPDDIEDEDENSQDGEKPPAEDDTSKDKSLDVSQDASVSQINIIVGDNSMEIPQAEDIGSPVKAKGKYDEYTFCDNTITSLIRKCWQQDPKKRPNFYEICSLLSNKL